MTEKEQLIKEREAYGGRIVKLGIQIAVIFLLPAMAALILTKYFAFPFYATFPFAFIISWTCVIYLYQKIGKNVKELDAKISSLTGKEENNI